MFKLKAYCISLKDSPENLIYIKNEWKDFLDIHHFVAIPAIHGCSKSHRDLLLQIWKNKETEPFPIVIMEDDVYKMKDFTNYWNVLLEINNKNLDYIAFDAFLLKFKDSQKNVHPKFVELLKHNQTGFNVYFKNFFDRFNSEKELLKPLKLAPIDLHFTHNSTFTKWTPKRQVLRQISNKKVRGKRKPTRDYKGYYDMAQEILTKKIK